MSPDWLKTRSLAAEQDGALNSFNAIGLKLASWVSLKTLKPAACGKFSKRWKSRLGSGWSWSRMIFDPANRASRAMKSNSFIFFDRVGSERYGNLLLLVYIIDWVWRYDTITWTGQIAGLAFLAFSPLQQLHFISLEVFVGEHNYCRQFSTLTLIFTVHHCTRYKTRDKRTFFSFFKKWTVLWSLNINTCLC